MAWRTQHSREQTGPHSSVPLMISLHAPPTTSAAERPKVASAAEFQATMCPEPSTANAASEVPFTSATMSRVRITQSDHANDVKQLRRPNTLNEDRNLSDGPRVQANRQCEH